ncbi:MAG: discoidin domain-containing protein, partial [Muribaculaceae bacterium]|nr:discoidin domain-containing protein [Muribaculaceae bacterium]
ASSTIDFTGTEFLTPRGQMRLAAGSAWDYSYRFPGMLPIFGVPDVSADAGFDRAVATDLVERYAQGGTFGTDTYWGGKGLVQMAMNMMFAKGLDNADAYELSKRKLRDALAGWFTYTPGKNEQFFSYFPRWGSMVGYNVSYDSDQFNDHHFHYGYFLYAGALLCLEDKDFARDYGPMLRHIAKEYANWEHDSADFPFLRTMDPWVGHSYAGGFGDHGNENGNGQESSSEAMQGWGGVYMLGLALDDKPLRDAGIFGWLTESKGTAEYWYDRDHVTHRFGQGNYDYTGFDGPYNCNITAKGIGWWNWFAGPWWNHIIQWMPVSPCLNYLSEDLDFARWEYEQFEGNNPVDWWNKWPNGHVDAAGNLGMEDALADASLGNVVVCYLQRFDPQQAAAIFDRAYAEGRPMAKNIDTGHISYYTIHSHLTYGDNDFSVYADYPAASAFRRADGSETYMVYNSSTAERVVRFYRDGSLVKTVKAPAGQLTVFADDPVAASVALESAQGVKLPPGYVSQLSATVLDQYGASVDGASATVTVVPATAASVGADGALRVNPSAAMGSRFSVVATYGALSETLEFVVGNIPALVAGSITPRPEYAECGTELQFGIAGAADADGDAIDPDVEWTVELDGEVVSDGPRFTPEKAGRHTVTAKSGATVLTHSFVVMPQLPNIALGRQAVTTSEQNAGTLTESLTDGDHSTRWGSTEGHDDGEWVMVDLGADCYMARLSIDWEASYAALYDVEIAPDGCQTQHYQQKKWNGTVVDVVIPDESAWTTALADVAISRQGEDNQMLNATARYLRVKPRKRSNQYGYSIYELAVHGVAPGTDMNAPAALQIACDAVVDEGAPLEVNVAGVTLAGDIVPVADVAFEADAAGEFNGSVFTPSAPGIVHITARGGNGLSTSATVLVNERERIRTLRLTPATLKTLADTRISIVPSAQSQFGATMRLAADSYQAVVTDKDGNVAAGAWYDRGSNQFVARDNGTYTLTVTADGVTATATIEVVPFAEANLALMKTATASSEQSPASMAVDGDPATRWESAHTDGESITVDLDDIYLVDRMRLLWEAAYAADYTVYASLDGENYNLLLTRTATPVFDGGVGVDQFTLPMPVPARYLRVVAGRRATAYGVSLWELEVYGTGRYDGADDGTPPDFSEIVVEQRGTSLYVAAAATPAGGYVVHDIAVTETGFDGVATRADI